MEEEKEGILLDSGGPYIRGRGSGRPWETRVGRRRGE